MIKKPAGWQVGLILAIRVLVTSSSAIFIRLSFAIALVSRNEPNEQESVQLYFPNENASV
jgi:hypothetical protein